MNLGVHTSIKEYNLLDEESVAKFSIQTITNIVFKNEEWFKSKLFQILENRTTYKKARPTTIKILKRILTEEIFDQNKIFLLQQNNCWVTDKLYTYLGFTTDAYTFLIEYSRSKFCEMVTVITVRFGGCECIIETSDDDDKYFNFKVTYDISICFPLNKY